MLGYWKEEESFFFSWAKISARMRILMGFSHARYGVYQVYPVNNISITPFDIIKSYLLQFFVIMSAHPFNLGTIIRSSILCC